MSEIPHLSVDELVTRVRGEYAAWKAVLASIPQEKMETPLGDSEWSVKDHVAHVAWFEREMVRLIETHSLASGSPYWYQEPDTRNRMIYEENRARDLAEVLREAEATHNRLVDLLEGLDDEDINSAGRYTAMPDDWVPWIIFVQNTFEHYLDHANDILTHI